MPTSPHPRRIRLAPHLLSAALLAVASVPAQEGNYREEAVILFARPIGSSPTTPYAKVFEVGTPGIDPDTFSGINGQPGGTPFPPFSANGSWPLVTTMEYEIRAVARSVCTAGYLQSVSLGQRVDFQLAATFGPLSAINFTSVQHTHGTEVGNPLTFPQFWDLYMNIGTTPTWNDTSAVAVPGCTAEATTSVSFAALSATTSRLSLLASAEVNCWQNTPPPFPSFAACISTSRIRFTVSQAMSLAVTVTEGGEVRGESQHFPILPIGPTPNFAGATGRWYDPPLALGFDFQQIGTSLFTDILTLPVGIDGDGLFEVQVGNQSLGQFAAGSRVDFRQILGGNGVPSFRIVGIDPAVDSTDAAVFPVQLAFNTPTAEFTMTPVLWRKVGANCAPPACVQCPALSLEPIGDAVEGNLNFGLGITNGPANGVAGFFVGLGSASPTPLPLLCGSVVLPLQNAILSVGTALLSGASSCNGAGSVPLPLAPVPALLGLFLTAQAVTLCPAGELGLTHGIEFAIGN